MVSLHRDLLGTCQLKAFVEMPTNIFLAIGIKITNRGPGSAFVRLNLRLNALRDVKCPVSV
jgi:hypothetical protein